MKPGKNDPCTCGSGKKYKKCCEGKSGLSKTVEPPRWECSQLADLLNAGRLAEVEMRARSLIRQYPQSGFVWKVLGSALQMQGKDGLSAFKKAAELLPSDAQAQSNLGNAQHQIGRLNDAAASYRRALKVDPDFLEALYNLGTTLKDLGHLDEAVASFRQTLKIKPDFAEALAALNELGQPEGVMVNCRLALESSPDSAEAHVNLGDALQSLGQFEEAVASYRRALEISPHFIQAHNNLSIALKRLGRLEEAVASYRRALEIKPDYAEVHFNLGNLLQHLGKFDEAVASYRHALEIKPDYVEAQNNLGIALKDSGAVESAVATCRQALEISPDSAEAHANLGNALQGIGNLDDAVTSYRRALDIKADYADAYNNLSIALKGLGRLDEAVASYRRALAINPDFAEAHFNLANLLQQIGRPDEAVASYRQALEINPELPDAHSNLGVVLKGLGQFDEAVASYRRALEINPDCADVHFNLGNLLQHLGRLDEAAESLRQTVKIKSDYPEAHNNLGNALSVLGQLGDAALSLRRAVETRPDYAEAHNNLGIVLKDIGQLDEALACYRRALEIKPDLAEAYSNLGNAMQNSGQLAEAVASYRRALTIKPEYAEAHSNLLLTMQYIAGNSLADIHAEHLAYAEQFEAPLRTGWRPHENSTEPRRRLKVGYVSPDLRKHSVAYFMEPVLARHDKNEVEVSCYYNFRRHDATTERIKGHADHWLDCSHFSDDELAQRIRDDRIDILVDLSGHTALNRLLTFARKPAPIQLTCVGYPATTGLTAMDYRLTDHHAEPVGMTEHLSTETLWRLPGCCCCYRSPENSPPVIDHPPSQDTGYITFGSFNNFYKITDAVLELWAQILARVPTARLFLKVKGVESPAFRIEIDARLHRLGLPLERVILASWSGNYLEQYNQIDIALDPFPYNGGTTSLDTLWMGVPFITLAGRHFAARAGVTLLANAGLPELIAQTPQAYVELATRLALDPAGLHDVRDQLREKVRRSPLMDEAGFTRQLEAAYREMWLAYCARGNAP